MIRRSYYAKKMNQTTDSMKKTKTKTIAAVPYYATALIVEAHSHEAQVPTDEGHSHEVAVPIDAVHLHEAQTDVAHFGAEHSHAVMIDEEHFDVDS